ncbi:MAG: sulfurtransferase [Sulfurimonas sp. RIFOXYD12_FULL_33_39]|uniref:rhodanese-like domain-containing protein n=1 Tax=unclassified Sulfurimonas TaxID=2623549 RepID=UPI0008B20A22|nr:MULTISPECIES: rhodanese-like domain-containing protein [unclassified Sulfurimonas]OHE09113.1 MAG: sulfurtransferase [Sulfurimonas sp. RIFOXYD12_FULL_33_39]OHE14430.1 MAG: sulfurtransferase [Sulfurimonas sp. RIFOXYD2_FULL_34_21]DAB28489.1 MAG TPA: sulfurtransferase [Sulfurimonas sp. UBA10385]
MKKILLSVLILSVSLFASVTNEEASQALIDSKMPIVDIRTPGEWKETGLLKGSIPIMLFDEKGKYDLKLFLEDLNKAVDTKKQFAIICRTGSRTKILAQFLSQKLNYDVVNIKSGIVYAKYIKLPILPYQPNN